MKKKIIYSIVLLFLTVAFISKIPTAEEKSVSNFQPGSATLDDLVDYSTKPVIYVQNDWYKRYTNTIEGIFSAIPRDGLFLIENGEWKRVKDAKEAIPALHKEEILYTLINENHRMVAEDGVIYTDYDEVDNKGIEEVKGIRFLINSKSYHPSQS